MEKIYNSQAEHIESGDKHKMALIIASYEAQQAKEASFNYLPLLYSSGGIIFLMLLGAIYRRRKQTIINTKNRLLNLELTALRSQINPHFLFNALNSINKFIANQNAIAANEYLTDFSKLMRYTLEYSDKMLIPLTDELKSLKMYIKMEQLRANHQFEFELKVDEQIDEYITHVPAMVIQPFVENAIWHGLIPKDGPGKLKVHFEKVDNSILIKVHDDGVGISEEKQSSNHKSAGMRLITERITLLKRYFKKPFELSVISNTPEIQGTLVTITVPDDLVQAI